MVFLVKCNQKCPVSPHLIFMVLVESLIDFVQCDGFFYHSPVLGKVQVRRVLEGHTLGVNIVEFKQDPPGK